MIQTVIDHLEISPEKFRRFDQEVLHVIRDIQTEKEREAQTQREAELANAKKECETQKKTRQKICAVNDTLTEIVEGSAIVSHWLETYSWPAKFKHGLPPEWKFAELWSCGLSEPTMIGVFLMNRSPGLDPTINIFEWNLLSRSSPEKKTLFSLSLDRDFTRINEVSEFMSFLDYLKERKNLTRVLARVLAVN